MIQFPRRKRLVLPTSNSTVVFPYELAPGKKCMCWIGMKELAQELDRVGYSDRYRLIGIHNDQIGNVYKSKPTNFDVAFWLRR
ncbi:MAG: hypothetical protein AVDCRST_MAG19-4510 [uncultured Thermomicrobiales bacterium]|uniref:Uncharacterized protein n=1 Tax=uncultured Thermomicrobiales bacterium TaxID=1645740 RepID=A0A6J4VTU8_9BACT|nr:MAG: hypothetical protein AVDCRST_MAG19-4510 [uncultured Thermomicrobiales bacterium]